MVKYSKILFLLCFISSTALLNAKTADFPIFDQASEKQDKTMTLRVNINSTSMVKMENVPTEGYLEVYSILGVRVMNVNLKTCIDGQRDIELPKGLYILKAGKVATKVIVR